MEAIVRDSREIETLMDRRADCIVGNISYMFAGHSVSKVMLSATEGCKVKCEPMGEYSRVTLIAFGARPEIVHNSMLKDIVT